MEFIFIIAIFGLLMFFMSRQNKKQRQAATDMRAGVEVGTKIVTNAGIYGEVVDIDGDVITLETTPGTELMTARNFIAAITEPPFEVAEEDVEEDEDAGLDITVPDDASALTGRETDGDVATASDGETGPSSAPSGDDSEDSGPKA